VRPLTLDLSQGALRPYFLWDEDISTDEVRARLHGPDESDRLRLMGKMRREARDIDAAFERGRYVLQAAAADDLRAFVADLIVRLRRAAAP
jgi:hypothetical protein